MKKFIGLLENKRSVAGLFILAGLVFNTYSIQENSTQIKRLTNFESGIQTCFTRVNQTYTANLLGDSTSAYLTQNFQNLTEECLAEGILSVENSFQKELANSAKQLSNLASNVHWFHEDLLAPAVATKALAHSGEARDVGSRFEKIETTKDEILESTNTYKAQITNALNTQKNIFYVSATLLAVLMLAEYMSLTRRRLSNNAREKEAHAELLNNGGGTSVKVGEIIRVALEQNNLVNCSKLFANFHAYAMMEKGKNKMSLETLVTPMGGSTVSRKIDSSLDKIWEDDLIGISLDQGPSQNTLQVSAGVNVNMNANMNANKMNDMNLDQMSSMLIDLLAEKLFSQGVQLNASIPENLFISARQEELEQALYHLFAYAINSTHAVGGSSEKNISVCAYKLGDVVAFDLIHSGHGFDESLLRQRVGLDNQDMGLDVDLQICQTLLSEIHAKIQLDNKIDQNGEIVGGRVKVIFKTGLQVTESVNNGRLVDLKVGSKKEILASLSGNASV